jgi:hypothetical protein
MFSIFVSKKYFEIPQLFLFDSFGRTFIKKSERGIQRKWKTKKTKMKECSPFLFQKSILKSPTFSIFLYDKFENLL